MATRRNLPSFFKLHEGDQFSNKLKIPKKNLQHFHGNVPHQCRLQTPARTWRVDVEEINNKFYFRKGWNQFVHEIGFKYGELLILHYAGNSDFHVDIFGIKTSQRLIVMPKMEEADDVSLEILDDSPLSSPLPHESNKTSSTEQERGETSRTQKHEHLRRGGALERAKAFKFENPSSVLVSMKPSYIKYGFVPLPSEVAMLVRPIIKNSGVVILLVSNGEVRSTWHAKLTCENFDTNTSKLHGDWLKFVRENNLEEDDVCVFMLIKDIRGLIEVVIFRNKDAANCTFSSIPADISDNDDDDKEDDDVDDDSEEDEYDDKEDDEVDDDSEEDEYDDKEDDEVDDDSEEDEYDDDYEPEADSEDEDESNSDDSIEVLDEFPPWLKANIWLSFWGGK